MNKIYVDDVVCKVIYGIGPGSGSVGVAVKYREENGSVKWLTNIEIEGIPNFYSSDERILEKLLGEDDQFDYDELDELSGKYFIKTFSDIELGEYGELLESLGKSLDTEAANLIKYILVVTCCKLEQTDEYISLAKGKYIGSIDVEKDLKSIFERYYNYK